MYLHIGSNFVVRNDEIIGIFDIDNTTQSKITRDFLNSAEKKTQIINAAEDIPRSFVVCDNAKRRTVYLSQLSSSTLLKRSLSFKAE